MTQNALVPTTQRPRRGAWRELCIALGVVCMAVALPLGVYLKGGPFYVVIMALSGLVLASYPMSSASNLLAQIVARAVWWQSMVFGLLLGGGLAIDVFESLMYGSGFIGRDKVFALTSVLYVAGAGMALAGAGRVGLNYASSQFVPVAFRRSLMASLVMALADTIALTFYGGLELTEYVTKVYGSLADVATFGVSAAVMAFAVWGLYRLKVWGVVLNAVANVVIAGMAMSGVFDLPNFLAFGLTATALGQVALLGPLMKRVFARA